jgi:hypothetical protein
MFEDQNETALVDLVNQKHAGKPITPMERPRGVELPNTPPTPRAQAAAVPLKSHKPRPAVMELTPEDRAMADALA